LHTDIVALIDPMPMLTLGPEAARQANDTSLARLVTTSAGGLAVPLRALVVGEDEHQLALLVDRIGDICVIPDDDRRPLPSPSEVGAAPLPQYVTETFAVPGLDGVALALRVTQLIEDVLTALEERADHA
jgi:chemotaxis signal transduction protein